MQYHVQYVCSVHVTYNVPHSTCDNVHRGCVTPHIGHNSPQREGNRSDSAGVARTNAATDHIQTVKAHAVPVTSCVEAMTAHAVPVIAHMGTVPAYTEDAMSHEECTIAHTEDAMSHIEVVRVNAGAVVAHMVPVQATQFLQ